MDIRKYNVIFHLHTITGIFICVALFIIFFAGAFSLFRDEIHTWEEANVSEVTKGTVKDYKALSDLDYDRVLDSLRGQGIQLSGRNLGFMMHGSDHVGVYVSGSTDSTATTADKARADRMLNLKNYNLEIHEHQYSFGELLYHLHFFYQLGDFGYYLAGLIALLFFFCIISGIVVHWNKIISNFFVFRPWSKWKTVWTDMHTALGIFSLPYQLMYALTGAYFCLGVLSFTPAMMVYDNDRTTYRQELDLWPQYKTGSPQEVDYSINEYINHTLQRWQHIHPSYVSISNYGNTQMHMQVDVKLDTKERFFGYGTIIYHLAENKIVRENNPYEEDYALSVGKVMFMLHFGYFKDMVGVTGDYALRILYFFLAMITGLVILSGLLIWIQARNKKSVPDKQRRTNNMIGHISLAACLSLFPITGLTFVLSRHLISYSHDAREWIINLVFFIGWILVAAIFSCLRNNERVTFYTLLSTAILGLLFPVLTGGIVSYLDNSFGYITALIDVIWLFLGILSVYVIYRRRKLYFIFKRSTYKS